MVKKVANEKVKVLVTCPRPDGYSKRAVVDYVRTAVHSHAAGFLGGSMVGEARKATAKEYKGEAAVLGQAPVAGHEASTAAILYALDLDPTEDGMLFLRYWNEGEFATIREEWDNVPEAVFIGADPLHPATKAELAEPEPVVPTLTTVQVLNEVVRGINSIAHMPPVDIRQSRREYWKAGARACLQMLNKSLQESADKLLGVKRPQPVDGELFNYWVEEARRSPVRVAKALMHCEHPDDYRAALWGLIKEDEEKMTGVAPVLNPEGGLV